MKFIVPICLIFSCFTATYGQMTIHPGNVPPLLPENIIQNVFLGNGIDILESNYSGTKASVGLFDNASASIGLERGIVLSTGFSEKLLLPNLNAAPINGSSSGKTIVDEDLEELAGVEVQDIAKFEITFVPSSDNLSFRYVFASEEYPKFVCGDKNDVFGFFISGPRPGGGNYEAENIARIPDPNDPDSFLDLPVTINSVNGGQPGIFADGGTCDGAAESLDFEQYYNTIPENGHPSFNAYLNVFSARAAVIPCATYTIKIAIGDGKDQNEDSAVFLEERSFSTEAIKVNINNPGIEGGMAEDCESGSLNFSLQEPTLIDFPLDIKILTGSDLVNPAISGVDFEEINENIFIRAGETSVDLSLIPITDGKSEGTEYIYLSLQKSICTIDTLIIPLYDNVLKAVDLVDTIVTCQGNTFTLEADLGDVNQADNLIYKNNEKEQLTIVEGYVASTIEVTGLKDIALNPSIIGEICIDKFSHPRLDHLDIYLTAPSGQILELSTDNGVTALAGSGLVQTCFSALATNNINQGNASESNADPGNPSYTGTYLPEGSFEKWLDPITSTLNGEYVLYIIDDTNEHTGELEGWSISFNPKYELDYNWFPNTGLTCSECEITQGEINTSQYYFLNITDSYGCTFQDSVWVSIQETAEEPILECKSQGNANIAISWDTSQYAEGYEFKIIGKNRWYTTESNANLVVGNFLVDIQSKTQIIISGLIDDEEITVQVRAINKAGCNSEIVTTSCSAMPCSTPLPQIMDVTVNQPQCSSDPVGQVIITAEADSDPLTYILRLENNTAYNATGTLRNIPPGTWPIRIVDALGCSIEDTVVVNEPPLFVLSTEFQNSTCVNEQDGVITLSISADNNPTMVIWEDGSSEISRSDLASGTYSVTVTDNIGCKLEEQFENINPSVLDHTYLQSDSLDCSGGGDVYATVFTYGGLAPYVTTWNGNIVSDTLMNLSPGTVSYEVQDAYGCIVTGSTEVLQVAGLQITFDDLENPQCHNSTDGQATAVVAYGSGAYSFLWSSGETSEKATALSAGINSVTISDSEGCISTATLELMNPEPITEEELRVEHPSCHDTTDGIISLSFSGGSSDLSYNWEDGSRQHIRNDLAAGTYCVTIEDAAGCSTEKCITLISPAVIEASVQTTTVSCSPGSDGTASLTVSGGTGNYNYEWSGPDNFSSQAAQLTGLDLGEYSVTVMNLENENCTSETINFSIEIAGDLTSEINIIQPISCHLKSDGYLAAAVTGGQTPFIYKWSNGSDSQEISGLSSDDYAVTITDAASCQTTAQISLSEPEPLEVASEAKHIECVDANTGEIQLYVTGGTKPYTITWNTGSAATNLTGLSAGAYTVTVTDDNNCLNEQTLIIESPENGMTISAEVTDESCYGEANGSIVITQENAEEPIIYILNDEPGQSSNTFSGLTGGSYLVTVIDAKNCSIFREIQVAPAEEIEVEISSDLLVNYGEDLTLEVVMKNTSGAISYEWNAPNEELFSCMDCSTPVISNIVRSFSASLLVIDERNCSSETYFNVNVVDQNDLAVPTGFSPNNDGMNDYLAVFGSPDIQINEFKIYNEMGQLIFSSQNVRANEEMTGWDGNDKGSALPMGSYIWTLNFTCLDGRIENRSGQSTLIR